MTIAKEGYPYILALIALTILPAVFGFFIVAGVFFVLAIFVTFFFRDPDRAFSAGAREILSPADGRIVSVRQENGTEAISIFLSIFDVHINRAPTAGKISKIEYRKGKFLAAFDERASRENEQNSITIDHQGKMIRFVQIAGLIARRIVCWKREGEQIAAGERIGLIKFGSRVDVFLPAGSKINVKIGEKVKAGQTVIGEMA